MEKIIAYFDAPDMSVDKYNQIMIDLNNSDAEHPEGRIRHTASQKGKGMVVVDIWESPELLQKFAGTLFQILEKNGVTPPQPELFPVVNEIIRS